MEVFNTSKKPLPLCCDTREVCHSLEEADTLSATGQRAPKPRISGSITPLWAPQTHTIHTHTHTHTHTHSHAHTHSHTHTHSHSHSYSHLHTHTHSHTHTHTHTHS